MKRVLAGRKNLSFLILFFLPVLFLTLQPAAEAAAVVDPLPQVRETVDKILGILEDPKFAAEDKKESKKQLIVAIVEDRFDFREMSRRTLASYWRRINTEQQKTFVDLFSKLLENTYIDKIEQYSGEKIVYGGHEVRGSKAVVESRVVRNEIEIPLVYRLILDSSGKWLVYDVIIEGVSMVSNYRSQFSDVIEKEHFSGLLERLEQKIADFGKEQR